MDRRRMLKTAGAAACVAAVPKLLNAVTPPCVYTKGLPIRGGLIGCRTCTGGMVGEWPDCYYPQYLNLNQNLANQVFQAHKDVIAGLSLHNLTQARWNNMVSLTGQLVSHLSVYQTYINECLRRQFVYAYPTTNITQSWRDTAVAWANQNGQNPNLFDELVQTAQPNMAQSSTLSTDQLHNQIMQLPDVQGMDNLSDWVYAQTTTITIQNGVCGIPVGDANNWVVRGGEIATAGAGLMQAAGATGPAAGIVSFLGEVGLAYGGLMGLAGFICRIE